MCVRAYMRMHMRAYMRMHMRACVRVHTYVRAYVRHNDFYLCNDVVQYCEFATFMQETPLS